MKFEWDDGKATGNFNKHRVSFDEACTVFTDPLALIFDDEWREIIIGYSAQRRLILVSFTERNDVVRLISARETTRRERKDYEENV
jgi:uncharacterized DUF497 family protein